MRKAIPNILTCLNLLSGCVAVVFVAAGEVMTGCCLVFLAAFFDFFDGFAARALNAWSPIGKELDSLADIISFGLVPGFVVFRLLQPGDFPQSGREWVFAAFLLTVFSARSEEHTSELQSLMRTSYAVFCLQKK